MIGKVALVILLIFGITGCEKKHDDYEPKIEIENDNKEEHQETKTITENLYGHMREDARYDLVYDGELVLQNNGIYLINILALEFEEEFISNDYATPHFSGKYIYSYGGKNYVVNLDRVTIGFFYRGKDGKSFFEINAEGKQIRYWLKGGSGTKLVINKIWRFVPNGD